MNTKGLLLLDFVFVLFFEFCANSWEAVNWVEVYTVMTDQQTGDQEIVPCLMYQEGL